MRHDRREFLQTIGTAGVVTLSGTVPGLWSRAFAETYPSNTNGRVLVLVQLAGGNDGLNTVVPYPHDAYLKARPALALKKGTILSLNDEHGLHPSLGGLKKLWDNQRLAIVQGIGYPQPDRSHFRSMDIWQAAQTDAVLPTGWIGRMLDATSTEAGGMWEAACLGMNKLPLTCLGERAVPPTIRQLEDFHLRTPATAGTAAWKTAAAVGAPAGTDLEFLRRSARAAVASAERLTTVSTKSGSGAYPSTGLAQKLKLVAQMIAADLPARVYFVSLDGFDTHAQQLGGHAALMAELSGAISAFTADLAEQKLDDRVMLATFSEFGRRVAENGSLGTDHGAASVSFVVTPPGRGGWFGSAPKFDDLDDGDLKYTTDFRRLYATFLDRWLQRPAQPILGGDYQPLDFA